MSRIAKAFRGRVGPLFAFEATMLHLEGAREMSAASRKQRAAR